MACIPAPTLPIIGLPFPLTISPPGLPPINLAAEICCKNIAFAIPPIPIPLPPLVLNPGVNAGIATALKSVQTFLDQFQISCPRE